MAKHPPDFESDKPHSDKVEELESKKSEESEKSESNERTESDEKDENQTNERLAKLRGKVGDHPSVPKPNPPSIEGDRKKQLLKEMETILLKNGGLESNIGMLDDYWTLQAEYRRLISLEPTPVELHKPEPPKLPDSPKSFRGH
jgi:hypothetical protein